MGASHVKLTLCIRRSLTLPHCNLADSAAAADQSLCAACVGLPHHDVLTVKSTVVHVATVMGTVVPSSLLCLEVSKQ